MCEEIRNYHFFIREREVRYERVAFSSDSDTLLNCE